MLVGRVKLLLLSVWPTGVRSRIIIEKNPSMKMASSRMIWQIYLLRLKTSFRVLEKILPQARLDYIILY